MSSLSCPSPGRTPPPHPPRSWTDGEHPRGIWRRTTLQSFRSGSPDWETVLDVDALNKAEGESWVYKGRDVFDDDTRVLLKLSRGGADATVVREFNLDSKSFVDSASGGFVIPEAKTRVGWKDKDTLLVGASRGGSRGVARGSLAFRLRALSSSRSRGGVVRNGLASS